VLAASDAFEKEKTNEAQQSERIDEAAARKRDP
jgi:hypothetical protein